MIASDWADWLVAEIASTTPTTCCLWSLGCNGFVYKAADGTTIFIDPYLGLGDPPRTVRMVPVPFDPEEVHRADAVFATHEHTDHVHGPSQGPILAETGATFVGPEASVAVAIEEEGWVDAYGLERDQFRTVEPGDAFAVGDVRITVAEAHDPDAEEPVSYLLEYGDTTVFHGGDSKPTTAFERIGDKFDIDVGILAFGSVGMIPDKRTREPTRTRWYSDENQVIEAGAALELQRLVPSHWDMWKGMTADPTALFHHARSFPYPKDITIMEIGDRLDLPVHE